MPKRQRANRIVSEVVQGDDSWVEIIFPTVKQARQSKNKIFKLQRALEKAKENGNESKIEKAENDLEAFSNKAIADHVKDWNWVDDDEKPFAKPFQNPDVFEELTAQEIAWLAEQFKGLNEEKKAP